MRIYSRVECGQTQDYTVVQWKDKQRPPNVELPQRNVVGRGPLSEKKRNDQESTYDEKKVHTEGSHVECTPWNAFSSGVVPDDCKDAQTAQPVQGAKRRRSTKCIVKALRGCLRHWFQSRAYCPARA